MTVLQELVGLYDRRAGQENWPQPGFSTENVGIEVVLEADGQGAAIRSLMAPDAKGKLQPRRMVVPAIERTSGIAAGLFWDKTAYSLGVTATEDDDGVRLAGQGKRTEKEHQAFRQTHIDLLADAQDPALQALRAFCETWTPERFSELCDDIELLDQGVVFRLGSGEFLHDLPAAEELLKQSGNGGAMCLVTGKTAPVARTHIKIKGVAGAQSSGAALVSFNSSAYESHHKSQGDNAPVSESAAFAYGTALNALLDKGSGNNLRIGDATVVFWASGSDEAAAENLLLEALTGPSADETDPTRDEGVLRDRLSAVAQGKQPSSEALDPSTRLFVLGLAPNAGRLSVRFWYPGTLDDFACHIVRFWEDCVIEPSPFLRNGARVPPRPWALLYDLAARRDAANIPSNLGGDLMRAILTGGRFPATLLAGVMGRIRVEGEPDRGQHGNVDGRRAAMIRAVLTRNHSQEVPMALDEDATDVAYLLGRLFGAYVYAERSFQERNAGLRQKYIAAASATPARVFPVLMRGYEHNLDGLRKAGGQKAGSGVRADRAVSTILAALPGANPLPPNLALDEQGRFFVGFYHQTAYFYTKAADAPDSLIDAEDTE